MANTGNTQGIRFKIMPPSSAPKIAAHNVSGAALLVSIGAAPLAALALSAVFNSGGICAT